MKYRIVMNVHIYAVNQQYVLCKLKHCKLFWLPKMHALWNHSDHDTI